jgi:ATP phosphoribosyltransferase
MSTAKTGRGRLLSGDRALATPDVLLANGPFFNGPFFFLPRIRSPALPMLRIALPNKGRLADGARLLLDDAGLDVRAASTRSVSAELGGEYQALFVRAQDIPEFVSDGAADAGITGWDLACESRRPVADRLDLGFGRCRLVFAVPDESPVLSIDQLPRRSRVATVFPNLTASFFQRHEIDIQVVAISGAVESAPHLGIADAVVDLTSTGSTLRANGLREVATVHSSSARLLAKNAAASDPNGRDLDALVRTLESVVRARGQRYLMANVPRRSLCSVREVLPGLNGPTITEILNGGDFVAVHAVVAAEQLSCTIAGLKTLGSEGILVTRIERLLP